MSAPWKPDPDGPLEDAGRRMAELAEAFETVREAQGAYLEALESFAALAGDLGIKTWAELRALGMEQQIIMSLRSLGLSKEEAVAEVMAARFAARTQAGAQRILRRRLKELAMGGDDEQ